jgi:hypothetical protein
MREKKLTTVAQSSITSCCFTEMQARFLRHYHYKYDYMENTHHKSSEFKNVTDTWDENERKLQEEKLRNENLPAMEVKVPDDAPSGDELENIVKTESIEYDHSNKEERILGGERASVNDDDKDTGE